MQYDHFQTLDWLLRWDKVRTSEMLLHSRKYTWEAWKALIKFGYKPKDMYYLEPFWCLQILEDSKRLRQQVLKDVLHIQKSWNCFWICTHASYFMKCKCWICGLFFHLSILYSSGYETRNFILVILERKKKQH